MWDFKKFKDNIAIVTNDGREITYEELDRLVTNWAEGIEKRKIIACFCRNSLETIICYVGALMNDVVPIMIDDILDVQFKKNIIDSYATEYIWVPKEENKIWCGYKIIKEYEDYVLMKRNSFVQSSIFSELALLLTTSGSTGSPKLVRQSYKNLLTNTESIIKYLNITSNNVTITTLPLFYTFGLSIVNTYLYSGAKLVLTNKKVIDSEFWELYKKEKINSISGVPYTYEMLKKIKFLKEENIYLKTMTQAGGKLKESLQLEYAKYCEEHNIEFYIMYGQTEATARMSYLPPQYISQKIGSIGIAIPNGRFWISDENGKEIIGTGEVGELVYEGGNVTLGYAENRADLAKGDERKGVLYTGDMARCDKDGFYYIEGRKKRFIKLYGKRVSLDECEQLISKYCGCDCVCVGADDNLKIVITEDGKREEVSTYIEKQLKIQHIAYYIYVVNEIPRNSSGKIVYKKVEECLIDET